jgi:hypothetical protein
MVCKLPKADVSTSIQPYKKASRTIRLLFKNVSDSLRTAREIDTKPECIKGGNRENITAKMLKTNLYRLRLMYLQTLCVKASCFKFYKDKQPWYAHLGQKSRPNALRITMCYVNLLCFILFTRHNWSSFKKCSKNKCQLENKRSVCS